MEEAQQRRTLQQLGMLNMAYLPKTVTAPLHHHYHLMPLIAPATMVAARQRRTLQQLGMLNMAYLLKTATAPLHHHYHLIPLMALATTVEARQLQMLQQLGMLNMAYPLKKATAPHHHHPRLHRRPHRRAALLILDRCPAGAEPVSALTPSTAQ